NEVLLLLKEDYIVSARVLGASRWYLIRKHLFPALRQKVIVLFLQQSSQMMLLLVQLGFFDLFLGGRNQDIDMNTGAVTYTSLSNEWAGLIGGDRNEIWIAPWIILAPLCMFALSIFMLNRMVEGISDGLVNDRRRSQGMKMLLIGSQNKKMSA
ncbi:MAG: ABC transporter permease subunit, partial [Bacillaceae bacterium]